MGLINDAHIKGLSAKRLIFVAVYYCLGKGGFVLATRGAPNNAGIHADTNTVFRLKLVSKMHAKSQAALCCCCNL